MEKVALFLGSALLVSCAPTLEVDAGSGEASCDAGTLEENRYCADGEWITRDDCAPHPEDSEGATFVCQRYIDCPYPSVCERGDADVIGCCVFQGPSFVRFRNATGSAMEALHIEWGQDIHDVGALPADGETELLRFGFIPLPSDPYLSALVEGELLEQIPFNDLGTNFGLGQSSFHVDILVEGPSEEPRLHTTSPQPILEGQD